MPHTDIVEENNALPSSHGRYGAVELGQGEEGATISVFRRQQHQEGGRGTRGKVGMVIAALVAVVLTAVAFASNTSSSSVSSNASPARLMSPSPISNTTGNDVAGNSPKASTGWQDMVPKDVLKANSSSSASSSSSPKGNHTTASRKVGGPARNCTLDECKTYSGCDPTAFPFVCVGGFAKGGCAKVQSAWEHPGCSDFCTLGGCAGQAPTCGQCSPEDCHNVQSVCGANRRYACVEGPSAGGCSTESAYWPQGILNGICKTCCDLKTCAPALTCAKCTAKQCASMSMCGATEPVQCTGGAAAGGCGTKDSWAKAGMAGSCTACCDTSACGGSDDNDGDDDDAATDADADADSTEPAN